VQLPGLRLDDVAGLPWRATRDAGVFWIPLQLVEESSEGARRGGGTVLILMEPGCGYAAHRHVGWEHVLVLRGGYRDQQGEYRAGEFVHYPAGSQHAPVALGERGRPSGPDNPVCVLYASTPLGIELLERGRGE